MKLVALIACFLIGPVYSSTVEESLPKDLEGVWMITGVTEDGVEQPLAKDPDGSVSAGEWRETEIVICKNRIVLINTDGSSMACKVKVLAIKPEVRIEVTTGVCHDKDGGSSYAILKRNGEELILAWVSPDMRAIDDEKGGGQIVFAATR